jgi:outer membrane protein assembly factor BamB
MLHEKALTPASVSAKTFGKLSRIPVDGRVDATPLYAEGVQTSGRLTKVVFIATEHDSVYAADAKTGAPLWRVTLLPAGETTADPRGCGQIEPEIGITATPVIDRRLGPHGTLFVVAMSKDAQGHYLQRIHALDMSDGSEEFHGPTAIQATYSGATYPAANGIVTFDPGQYAERAALLLENGVIYTTWTSHCDRVPYTGWIIAYRAATLQRVAVLNLTPNGQGGAIWQSGAGPAADPQGSIYLMTGNGTFDTTLDAHGFPSGHNFGNSFVKLSERGATLAVDDYFTMFDVLKENASDGDLGSGGPMVLPDMKDGTGRMRHLVIGAGKDRNIYLADRNAMGRFNLNSNGSLYQELPQAMKHSFVRPIPAYFDGWVFYGGTEDPLRAYAFRDGHLRSEPVSQTASASGYPGVTPSISADGSKNGIVWFVENQNFYKPDGPHDATLHAYDARDLAHELYNSAEAPSGRDNVGANNKFVTPVIAGGRVYIATPDSIVVFGLLGDSSPDDKNRKAIRGPAAIAE